MVNETVELYPIALPEQPDLSGITGFECLDQQEPIHDLEHMKLHIAMLTAVCSNMIDRIKELEQCQLIATMHRQL